jgi:hypothetical protein
MKKHRDTLYLAGVATVIWMYGSAMCLVASALGQHKPQDKWSRL